MISFINHQMTLFGLICLLTVSNVFAAPLVFTDRALWEAAVTSFSTENFNALPLALFSTGTNSAGLVDVNVTGNPGNSRITNLALSGISFGANYLFLEVDESAPDIGTAALIFNHPISAFGADWASTTNTSILEITVDGSLFNFSDHLTTGGGAGFLGFVSATPFSNAAFSIVGTTNEQFALDNLSFTEFTATPVPPALWLFGSGLMGLIGFARRKA